MPGPQPDGQPAPADGALPEAARSGLTDLGSLSWYFHVPYCRARCGYCDFNTYTAAELRGGATAQRWADTAIAEIRLARTVLGDADVPAPTVFFGGGTPSLLPPEDLGRVLAALRAEFGIAADAEITAEANPDDVTDELLTGWLAGGINRISLGMQSAVPGTLRILERTHRAAEVPHVVSRIRRSGMPRMSLDLIYGTPGESAAEWARTLEAVLALDPGHVSAYCLGIEEGTRLGARLRAGSIDAVDPDTAADRYEATDEVLQRHGYDWYEISNWSRPALQSRHNLTYWRGGSWWGAGPGAHSHISGVRWWNVRHPSSWTEALAGGRSPAEAREVLTPVQQRDEAIMLGIRLSEGLPASLLPGGAPRAGAWVQAGYAEWTAVAGNFRLTRTGRLIADRLALDAITEEPVDRIADDAPGPYTGTQSGGVPTGSVGD